MRRRRGVCRLRRLRRCHRQASTVPHTAGPPACRCCQPLLRDPEGPQTWLQAARLAMQCCRVRHAAVCANTRPSLHSMYTARGRGRLPSYPRWQRACQAGSVFPNMAGQVPVVAPASPIGPLQVDECFNGCHCVPGKSGVRGLMVVGGFKAGIGGAWAPSQCSSLHPLPAIDAMGRASVWCVPPHPHRMWHMCRWRWAAGRRRRRRTVRHPC